ncbi:hypothetical protein CGLO_08026 [Colletotrichum gloeosporioides Cg-14]|uniref:Uncharacterized protein n=1 Tax=Colletotrichum gloeosporioides (strain Cg-14) TaxID=1237896 RepID=T0LL05_COLGC|nr:hypothetical protein CGLO_08026 [Colletotrichum gloeosporioides Cg-14]
MSAIPATCPGMIPSKIV